MPIPQEILAVKRPSNTVVQAYGKNKDRYAVKQRIGCRRVGGRNVPVNGPTVGHIVDGVYVPAWQVAYVDGTAPHVREVPFPAASGAYLDLGQFYRSDELVPKLPELMALTDRYRAHYARAYNELVTAWSAIEQAASEAGVVGSQAQLDI